MKNGFTPLVTEKKKTAVKNPESLMGPGEKTIALLKLFARNYQVETKMPEGLREMVLS